MFFLAIALSIPSGCVNPAATGASSSGSGPTLSRSLNFVDAPSYDVGTVAAGSTVLIRLSVASIGTGDARITSTSNSDANFAWNGGTFPGTGGSCAQPVQGNCAVAVLFSAPPAGSGIYSDTVSIAYDSGGGPASLTITLHAFVAVAANLTINGGAADAFGTKNVGSVTDHTLTIANVGGTTASAMAAAGFSAPIGFKGGAYPGTGGTCGVALGSGANCTVVVTYAPVAAGTTNETYTMTYNNGITAASTNIAVGGTALSFASVTITAPVANPYDYGNVVVGATGSDVTVTLSNGGGQAATALTPSGLSAPILYKGGAYPGTGGTCGASIGAAATCTIVVTFTPTVTGAAARTLGLSYFDGGATRTLSQGLQGNGVNPATLAISDGATYDFGSHVKTSTTTKTFTVTNSGGAPGTAMSGAALAAPYSYAGGAYPGTAGTCGASLAAGANCMVVVNFVPAAAGTFNSTLQVNYTNGIAAGNTTRPMTGVGTLPAALLSITTPAANPYSYGTVLIGAPGVDLTVTLSNGGGQSATSMVASGIAAPFAFKGGAYPGTGGTCAGTLAAAATCTMIVTFTPTAAGFFTRTLSVAYVDGTGGTPSVSRPIEGTGQFPASLAISDAPTYDFGSQVLTTSAYHAFTVTNSGGTTATALSGAALSAPFAYRGGSYPGTGGTCAATLAAAGTCTIVLAFTPTAATSSSGTLSLSHNTGLAVTNATRAIAGTGVYAPASLSITTPVADPYDYGTITIGAPASDVTMTVSNSGGQSALSLSASGLYAPFGFKDGVYPGTGGTCGATLAASATCTLVVSFLPTTPGIDTSTLDLAYDDGTASTIHLTHGVRGTGGNAAVLAISDGPTYDFGSHATGTNTDYSFTVTNTGGSPATAIAGGSLTLPFKFKGGAYPGTGGSCAASLGASANCTVIVTFAPTATGGYTDSLSLGYSNGISAVSSARAVSGTGGTVANLTISDGTTYDFGSVVKTYSATKTLTVTNVGGSSATALSGAALSAPFAYFGGAYPGTGGTCGNSLGAAGTCTVLIQFSPTSAATSSGTLTLNYFDAVSATSSARALSGTGATISVVAGGADHTCALYSSGVVKCWGDNTYGQLGNGTNSPSTAPVLVSGLTGATDLASGSNHTCALSSGRVYCWGRDHHGQIGDNATLLAVNTPAQVALFTDFTQIAAGGDLTCALRSGGTIACWGDDTEGGNGNNAAFVDNATPATVSGLTTMVDVSVGRGHACAARSTGSFRCWGSNTYGQLANGGGANQGVPVNPGIASSVRSVAGGDTSCDFISGGTVKCWGADDTGELGDGAPYASQTTAITIANLANYSAIKLGLKHGCGIDAGSNTNCWGADLYGQLGNDATLSDQPAPVAVSGMSATAVVGVGENHACAARTSGSVYCWGANSNGQLGDGSLTQRPTPVLVQGL